MAVFSSPWTLFLYIWHIFLTWSLTFLAPVFLTPALKNLIGSVRSYLRRSSSRNHEKIAASGFRQSQRRWVDRYPCRSGRDGTNSRDSRSAPIAPFFDSARADSFLPFFLVLVGARGRERWLFIFFMGLYINSKEFFINFFEPMKKCSTLDGENRIGTNELKTIFWKST